MEWRKPDDFPKETGEQLCEVIRKRNGVTTIYPTYVKFIADENYWLSSPVGYGVHRWLDESTPLEKTYSEEEMDRFAMEYSEWCVREVINGIKGEEINFIPPTQLLEQYKKSKQ